MKTKRIAVLALALLLIAVSLTACGLNPAKKIVGTWINSQSTIIEGVNTETKYVFNEDGTGTYTVTLATVNFTYEFNDDGKLVLTKDVPLMGEKVDTYTVEFEKETLRLTDVDGAALTFTKQA